MPDGARLLLADFWTDVTHKQPLFAALMAAEFFVITGEGDVYSEEEAIGWLQESGWRVVERKSLAGPVSLLVAEHESLHVLAADTHHKAIYAMPCYPQACSRNCAYMVSPRSI